MKKAFLFFAFVIVAITSNAQPLAVKTVFEDWFTSAGTQNFFYQGKVVSDRGGNTYMCGATINQYGNYDILVQKYSPSILATPGSLIWSQQIDGNGNGFDAASSITLDANDDVYVVGTTYYDATDSNNVFIVKFNGTSGTQVWYTEVNGSASLHDGAADIVYNGKDLLGITGLSEFNSANYDFFTLCYDTLGNYQWRMYYDYNGLNDGGYRISCFKNSFIVAGAGQLNATDFDYVVLDYDQASGTLNANTSASGSASGFDEIADVAIDTSGNVYVTGGAFNGGTYHDYMTIKMDSDLVTQWTSFYDGASSKEDKAKSIAVDDDGGVYVTGYSTETGDSANFLTVKYSENGTQLWTQSFNGGKGDTGKVVVLDKWKKYLYVSGSSFNGTTFDYHTIKYDTAGVGEVWNINFNSWENGNDIVKDMALDSSGGIVIIGQTEVTPGIINYNTVHYIEKDIITPPDPVAISNSYTFEENRGQLLNTSLAPQSNIRFYSKHQSPATFFSDTSVSYVWSHVDTSASVNDSIRRVDLKFLNSEVTKVLPMDLREDYYNYYLSDLDYPVSEDPIYDRVIYPDLYLKTDLMFASNALGMKHYFIMRTGADPTDIDMKFSGADSVKIVGNSLTVYTKLGTLRQGKAKAFIISNTGNRVLLGWQPDYLKTLSGDIKFTNIGAYPADSTLVFECDWGNPTPSTVQNIEWSTYYGGNNNDEFVDVTTDTSGNVYATGNSGSFFFPTTSGSFIQTNPSGTYDAVIVMFDSLNNQKYATYYGSTSYNEYGNSIAAYPSGEVVICGISQNSSGSLPTYQSTGINSYFQNAAGGSNDGFIFRINPQALATPSWATYFGGAGVDNLLDLKLDASNNLYVVGRGGSSSPLRNHTGAYYDNTGDAIIAKFDTQDSLIWCTTVKGSSVTSYDVIGGLKSVTIDVLGNIYAIGNTDLNTLPVTNPGSGAYYDGALSGSSDGYIIKFNTSDTVKWCTYIGGSTNENLYAVEADANKNVFLTGWSSSSNFPYYFQTPQYIDSTLAGASDIVIMKFYGSNNNRLWSTYYGTTGGVSETPRNITFDNSNNIYLVGYFQAAGFPNVCYFNSYCQSNWGGNGFSDAFILAFEDNLWGNPAWSTYFGDNFTDAGYGCTTYKNHLYMVGNCGSNNTTINSLYNIDPGFNAYVQGSNAGPGYTEGFITKFDVFDIASGIIDVNQPDNGVIIIYPNPSSGNFTLQFESYNSNNIQIKVYNNIGQIVYSDDIKTQEVTFTKNIDLSDLSNGIYIVNVITDNKVASAKIIIQK